MNMRKLVAIFLATWMVLCSFPALAAPGDATILRRGADDFNSGVTSISYLDGTVYILTYDNNAIYTWKDGDAAATRHEWTEPIASEEENGNIELRALFSDGGELYLLAFDTLYEDEMNEFLGAYLYKVEIGEDGSISAEESMELDWDDMLETYDDNEYSREVRMPFAEGGVLYFLSWGSSDPLLICYDMEQGEMLMEAEIKDLSFACPYKDGRVLTVLSRYDSQKEGYSFEFAAFDRESEESETLFTLENKGYSSVGYVTYDSEEDAVYYALSGEIWKITGNDPATALAVNSLPLDGWSESLPILTEDKCLVVMDYQTVAKRSTDVTQRPATRMVVQNSYVDAMQSAYYDFTNQHGDVEVVLVQSVEDLLQAMLNRSDKVDVYSLYAGSADYEAVFSRGYMAELSGSETLTALVDRLYPAFQEVLIKDGELVALPVELYSYCSFYNLKAMEKLGLTQEDMPTSWPEYFEFLKGLPAIIEQHPGVTVFEPYMTQENARSQLMYNMVNDYLLYISLPGNTFAFDTPVFRAMIEGLESVDFSSLGLPEEVDEEAYGYQEDSVLLPGYMSDLSPYASRNMDSAPLLLALGEGMEPVIQAQMQILFVNPYSQNRELAIQFLEAVAGRLDETLLTKLMPDKNDPIPNAYYDQQLASYDENLETLRAQLESADEDDKPQYQQQLEEMEEYKQEFLQTGAWTATEESIAKYRELAGRIMVSRYAGMEGDGGQEFYTLMEKYMAGEVSAEEFIQGVDQKLQMMMLEGA